MSKVYQLRSMQQIATTLQEAWQFFSDPANLIKLTPAFLHLKVTNPVFGGQAYAGQIITYSVRPLLGIPFFWMTEITHLQAGKLFVDEQRRGPYKLWHHQHHFRELEGAIEMTDLIHYQLPMGVMGNVANSLVVQQKLTEIFTYRYARIEELFGALPDQKINLIFS